MNNNTNEQPLSKDNANKPAMPIKIKSAFNYCSVYLGLTKREYFAAMAMQGLLAQNSYYNSFDLLASDSVKQADALLKELEK